MCYRKMIAPACAASIALAAVVTSFAVADPATDAKPAAEKTAAAAPAGAQPEMKLPPGWTAEDMQAMAEAGTPGKMHQRLAGDAGTWKGKSSMWMAPGGGEAMTSACTMTITKEMDGRYVKGEMTGELPGMGPYRGMGIMGYDNVTRQFVATWIDSMSTGIMNGTGELSADGKTITWQYSHNCPITKKPTVMRQVETNVDANTKTLEMFGADPKTGKEFKMMRIEMKRKAH